MHQQKTTIKSGAHRPKNCTTSMDMIRFATPISSAIYARVYLSILRIILPSVEFHSTEVSVFCTDGGSREVEYKFCGHDSDHNDALVFVNTMTDPKQGRCLHIIWECSNVKDRIVPTINFNMKGLFNLAKIEVMKEMEKGVLN